MLTVSVAVGVRLPSMKYPFAVQLPQELGACQVMVSFPSPGVTCTFCGTPGAVGFCASAGKAANRNSAPSSSARKGRKERWRARSSGRREPVDVEGASLPPPAGPLLLYSKFHGRQQAPIRERPHQTPHEHYILVAFFYHPMACLARFSTLPISGTCINLTNAAEIPVLENSPLFQQVRYCIEKNFISEITSVPLLR